MSRLSDALKYLLRYSTPLPRQVTCGYLEWALLRDVLDRLAINIVLDVGANYGQYARNLRRIGYRGVICSFEPVPEAFYQLSAAMSHDPRWVGFPFALGCEENRQVLNIPLESSAMSSFLSPLREWELKQIAVDVRRLDSMIDEVTSFANLPQTRLFLKMDTQGYDLEVFRGASGCIGRILGIQSEVSVSPLYCGMPHYLDAIQEYERMGFQLCGLSEIARDAKGLQLVEVNGVMVRADR